MSKTVEACYIEFGKIIQRKRIHLGMTQVRFSAAFKINRVQLSKLENGQARMTFHDAIRISRQLKINLNGLLK
jgi:transcriptional regulator with XRE-family HTH domain